MSSLPPGLVIRASGLLPDVQVALIGGCNLLNFLTLHSMVHIHGLQPHLRVSTGIVQNQPVQLWVVAETSGSKVAFLFLVSLLARGAEADLLRVQRVERCRHSEY